MTDFRVEEIRRRLMSGEYLELASGAGAYEVWAEPYGNPPQVFYEGEPFPIDELDGVIKRIIASLERGEVRARWTGNRDD